MEKRCQKFSPLFIAYTILYGTCTYIMFCVPDINGQFNNNIHFAQLINYKYI